MSEKCIKTELRLLKGTKCLTLMLVSLIVSVGILYVLNYTEFMSAYDGYTYMKDFYQENGETSDDGYEVIESDDGDLYIENPLAYYKAQTEQLMVSMSVRYAGTEAMEGALFVFPAIFGLLGLFYGAVDYKNHIVKHKVSRLGKQNYWLSKVCVMFLMVAVAVLIYIALCAVAAIISTAVISGNVNLESFDTDTIELSTGVVKPVALMMAMAAVYAAFGLGFGMIFKTRLPGAILILLYAYALPISGKFDLTNSIKFMVKKLGCGYGVLTVESVKDSSVIIALTVLAVCILIPLAGSYVTVRKRSAFN